MCRRTYSEHLELSVDGTIIAPEKLQGRRGPLTFLGDRRMTRDLENPIEPRTQPLCVGSLTIWGETTGYLGSFAERHDLASFRFPISR